MVLSDIELQLAEKIMDSMQNVTTYSYDVMVKGTAMSSLLDTMALFIGGIIGILVWWLTKSYIEEYNKHNVEESVTLTSILAGFAAFVGSAILILIIFNSLLGYFNPEYVLMNKILGV